MAQVQIRDLCRMRSEIERLRSEREELMRVVGAALVLVNDLDEDMFESYEAAELVAECLNHLPDPVLNEVMNYSRY